ncbi:DUF3741 domain-containing protein/DUF4378 domain-containing protein [Heracleum sosnowskyi]|uniref:DUF3741 domain-containing protein/DUF4378 domain-containing protein n=1 Tax=Heracleum sosnowskyi TaxID=360622 RepID=A0AAD8GRM4_9APIA|nr:DUF3741 domain-containing protein/DUF4378 domain-containing protein [Heracleum sosnowskyi]
MNGIHNHKARNLERPYPGCLGCVVSLFDLSAGMPGNKLLMEKPHRDGSPLTRCRSDVSGMSLVEDPLEDKMTISELQSSSPNRKSHGTPIKMLIAQEMSKEVDSKQKPPSVVARLMGLDTLPLQQSYSPSQRNHSRGSSRSQSCVSFGSWQEEQEIHQYQEQNGYKDVYEIRQPHKKYVKDKVPRQERFDERSFEKKMALVRQNFIELKRLSTDEKLRHSKQFQDALEVLSSNKDSFLKFLQEPNSMFSQQLSDLQSNPLPSEKTKRITILKPAKMVDSNKVTGLGKKDEEQINEISQIGRVNRLDKIGFSPPIASKFEDSPVQATRIVVLKPSPGKSQDIRAAISPLSPSPKALHVEDSRARFEDDDAKESREMAKEITRQMCENLRVQRRDETLLSSVISNGYTGDESSFDKSEIEFAAENLSDSEAMSPTSRHSWDYINRLSSPYSLSTFSRASYSPESSVCREAKKRLSERWAMMTSNGSQEQKHVKRSSNTLGEMLALSDMRRSVIPEKDSIRSEQDKGSTSRFTADLTDEDKCYTPTRNILRSKSVPASSTAYSSGFDSEVSDPKMENTDIVKELTKSRSMTSMLKGRVSSLFFSRTNKSSKQKSSNPRDKIESAELPRHPSGHDVDIDFEGELPYLLGSSNKASPSHSFSVETKGGLVHTKAESSATKPCPSRNPFENQEQPRSFSVLETPFQEDDHMELEFSDNFSLLQNGFDLPAYSGKSNLIDKSPPVRSIARTLSQNDSCTETVSLYPLKTSVVMRDAEEERCHSLESPLDPLLRDNYLGLKDKEILHEAKRMQYLVFDCVNAALGELAVYESGQWKSRPCDRVHDQRSIFDSVWTQMEWFSGEVSSVLGESWENNSLVVEGLVRKDVIGKGWVDQLIMEIDNFRKEIEVKLLEELVQEAVEEFTDSLR